MNEGPDPATTHRDAPPEAPAAATTTHRDAPPEAPAAAATYRDPLHKAPAAAASETTLDGDVAHAGATSRDPKSLSAPSQPVSSDSTTRDASTASEPEEDDERNQTLLDVGVAAPAVEGPPGAFTRINLPPPLAARLRLVRELASGAEADVVLAADRETGDEVAVKLFRPKIDPSNAMLDALAKVGSPHILRVTERAEHQGHWWEVMEYLPRGALSDVVADDPPPWPAQRVFDLVEQIAGALSHSHALRLIHRDVKPQNILVRSLDPFSVVLSDYGLATVVNATRDQRSSSRTPAYAAPEAAFGEVSPARDWWSLGMTALELLTGTHPFRDENGEWYEERQIARMLYDEPINLDNVEDPRWKLFFRGVFQRKSVHRWGAIEVLAWLHGESPAVIEDATPPVQRDMFAFRGSSYDSPATLAVALAREWPFARRLIAGIRAQAPQSLLFVEWLERAGISTIDQLSRNEQPSRTLAKLLVAMHPSIEPVFGLWKLSVDRLPQVVTDASSEEWQGDAGAALDDLYTSGMLSIFARVPGQASLAEIDERWNSADDDIQRLIGGLPKPVASAISESTRRAARGWLLLAAVNNDGGSSFDEYVQKARASAGMSQQWFAKLAGSEPGKPDHIARVVLAVMTETVAAELARKELAAAEVQRKLDEQKALELQREELQRQKWEREREVERERELREMRRHAPINALAKWSVILALLVPPLAILTAVLAYRQISNRMQRGKIRCVVAIVIAVLWLPGWVGLVT